jgi:hypothetical protein
MSTKRSVAQHRSQIRQLRRSIAINTPIIAAFLAAAVCSYVFDWHALIKAPLTFISFMQFMHLPGLFTRLTEQKRKLAAAEISMNETAQQFVAADRREDAEISTPRRT